MPSLRHAALVSVALLLAVAACSTGDEEARSTTTERPAATTTTAVPVIEPAFTSALGPYEIGRRTISITDPARGGRELTTDIWYPTDAIEGEPSTYSFVPGIEYDSEVALDAPPVSADGPFPLVVYSHGSGGIRYVSGFFTELLASHGFVVVAPDHAGNTTLDRFLDSSAPREEIILNRPLDVSAVLTAVLDGSVDAEVASAVDPERIGVTGHSFGAYTALAIGGGVEALDLEADDRFDAIVAFAPAVDALTDEDMSAIDVPTMVVSGTLDETTPIDPNTERTVAAVTGRPLHRVDLRGATHQSFTDVCDYTVLLRELPDIGEDLLAFVDEFAGRTCDDDVLDVEVAQELINRYAVAFLMAQLDGSTDAAAVLEERPGGDVVDYSRLD